MNTNPQAAAKQASKQYRDVTTQLGNLGFDTAIPERVRPLAEKIVAHTRDAYDRSMDAFEASVATFATTFNRKIADVARRNVNSTFDLATSLAGAKNLTDMVKLRAAYWRTQVDALTAQAEEVRVLSNKVSAAAAEPVKSQMERGVDELRKAH